MKQLADDLFVLEGFPPYAINVYLLGDVLIDAATRFAARRILRRLRGRTVSLHALTHAHPDHQGASHAICERWEFRSGAEKRDAVAMERRGRDHGADAAALALGLGRPAVDGPPHPVSRRLREGDQVGSLHGDRDAWAHGGPHLVLARGRPGSDHGRCALQREHLERLGDASASRNGSSRSTRLRTAGSARRFIALEPKLVCFGHGPPLCEHRAFVDYVKRLPDP